MDVFDVCVKSYYCDFNNKLNIPVQKIKVQGAHAGLKSP